MLKWKKDRKGNEMSINSAV